MSSNDIFVFKLSVDANLSDFGHTMEFYILHIRFPDENSAEPAKFQQVADFSFSMMQTVAMYILDAVRRIVCVVCRYPETDMLGIYVVLDWNTGESNLINTGLTYVRAIRFLRCFF